MKTNVNLQPYNSFGFDAVAKYFVEIKEVSELQTLINSGVLQQHKILILSGGNNILFQEDIFFRRSVFFNVNGCA